MITLNASGGSVTFTFSGNSTYLNDGTITVPVNSLALIIDESDMATFKKAASNDIFVSANIAEFGMTKAELESWYKANMVGSTGGGSGSGVTPSEVQTMIDESISGKADSSAVTEEISAAVSGKVNVSDNIVSAHTFNARSAGNSYFTKLKFNGRDFSFNDFHSKKISVFPFGGINGQLFTSLYVEGPDYTSYDAAAYLSGSTSDDYPSSFTSVTWTGDETKMKVEINSEGYLDLIAQGEYWFGAIASNVAQELYVNILNDIASGQSASVINDSIVNNLENLGNTINGIQYEINGKLDASAYTPINVDSTLSQASANPIQNKSLFNELRVSGASSGETTIVFVNRESTNYPEGVTVIKFEPTQSNTWASYEFYNGSSYLGGIQVSYYGNISVELSLDGATYTTSGNTVILTVPSTLGITKIAQLMGEYSNFTVKVENPPIYTTLKDVVNGKANQSDFTAYTADTTPKVNVAWQQGIRNPYLYFDDTSGITLQYSVLSGGNWSYDSLPTDDSIWYSKTGNSVNVLGVYATGATRTVNVNPSEINQRIYLTSIPPSINMYWNASYTGSTTHYIAVSCLVSDGTNGYCQWNWDGSQYVPNSDYINTAVTLSYDSTNQVVTITPSSSSALTSIIYVRCNRNIAPATALTQDNCRIGAVTIDTNSYKLQEALDNKQDTLIAGDNITISGNVISATGGGSSLPISAGTGTNSVIVGSNFNEASGPYSHAEGDSTYATAQASHSEGNSTSATSMGSHSEGRYTQANGMGSHSEGYYTIAENEYEHANGKFNASNTGESTSAQTLFSVGNGGWDETLQENVRHNAFEIRQNGDIYCSDGTNDVKLQDTITATAANTTALGGLKLVKLTQAEYDALTTKDNSTLYVIVN